LGREVEEPTNDHDGLEVEATVEENTRTNMVSMADETSWAHMARCG
jgi:hypothetical protein